MFTHKVKILLVDDRPENLLATKMTLSPLEDVDIYTALSGNEGLALMLEHDFAVVLLDVQMPGMDGFETASLMQNHKVTSNVPIIFVTAISKEEEHVFKGYRSGAVDYLFKPINPDILLSKVKVFVKLYQQRVECERMQLELQKNKNLEALGVLAGGIAHDFNNLLSTIFGYIELAQMLSEPESKIHRKLSEAAKAANQASKLTRQLLTFSKGGRPEKESVDVTDLLADITTMSLSGSKVEVHLEIGEPIDEIEVDKGQISQVFQNLLFNAKEAMEDGGNLTIRVENITIEDGSAEPLVKDGRYTRISFEDDGPGIDPENIGKIFDPYFSSKYMGEERGQGLGLTIAHSIIKKHGGSILAESRLGEGSIFHVYLPITSGKAPSLDEAAASVPSSSAKSSLPDRKRILVMEDEKSLAGTFRDMLEYLGYEVSLAANGPEAIELFTRARGSNWPFAVVILELTIWEGEGAEKVLASLQELDPEVKAIVTSGYADEYTMVNFENCGFVGAINKPFSLSVLAATMEKII